MAQSHLQLGKNGLTESFIQNIKRHFESYQNVKISVLKSAGHEKEKMNEYADEILEKLGNRYTARVLGFTIFLKRWRREVR